VSGQVVKLPRDLNGAIRCRECGTALYFVDGKQSLRHPGPSWGRVAACSLRWKRWTVQQPTIDAIEYDLEDKVAAAG
jgi:hypothetical protein